LTREEALKAAKQKKRKATGHLADCEECREAVSLLAIFEMSGRQALPSAPEGMIRRAIAIGAKRPAMARLKEFMAEIIFDSWTIPAPVGVRGSSATEHRRIRFQSDKIYVDVMAESSPKEWRFIAAIGGGAQNAIIKVGRMDIYPDKDNVFQWSGKRPPRRMTLYYDDKMVRLPELSWKRPPKK
jgi:hypothetical protein